MKLRSCNIYKSTQAFRTLVLLLTRRINGVSLTSVIHKRLLKAISVLGPRPWKYIRVILDKHLYSSAIDLGRGVLVLVLVSSC